MLPSDESLAMGAPESITGNKLFSSLGFGGATAVLGCKLGVFLVSWWPGMEVNTNIIRAAPTAPPVMIAILFCRKLFRRLCFSRVANGTVEPGADGEFDDCASRESPS
jgi:hypothetical protein